MAKKKLEIVKITPTPPVHEAVLVTEKNYTKVAAWLRGSVKRESWGDDEPVYTFQFPIGGLAYGPAGEVTCHPGTYIVKPAREQNGRFLPAYAVGAHIYDTFFTVVEG